MTTTDENVLGLSQNLGKQRPKLHVSSEKKVIIQLWALTTILSVLVVATIAVVKHHHQGSL